MGDEVQITNLYIEKDAKKFIKQKANRKWTAHIEMECFNTIL